MEELIWIVIPVLSALITARLLGRVTRTHVIFAIVAGGVGWALGPRCLCTDAHDLFVGSFLFAAVFGVATGLLFSGAFSLYKRSHRQ